MNKTFLKRTVLRFRQFRSAGYAAFASMCKIVHVGHVRAYITDLEMLKSGKALACCAVVLAAPVWAADTEPKDSTDNPRLRELQEISVMGQRNDFHSGSFRTVTTISADEIQQLPVKTMNDLLHYLPGIDLRERGAGGVQADLSMRGGTGKQVKVLLNGVDMTDAQTEHYSMDLPIDPQIIERIEILQGANYAIDAFTGAINIITRSQQDGQDSTLRHAVIGQLTAGEYGLVNPSLSARVGKNNWFMNTSASYNRSSGYDDNTDYKITNFYFQTGYKDLDIQLGAQMKDAGANSFYSTKYPHQFDATRTALVSAAYDHRWNSGWGIVANAYYRAHFDRFELFRDSMYPDGSPAPSWYSPNIHWMHQAGAHLEGAWSNNWTKTTVGLEAREEWINSSNMGVHQRTNIRYFAEQRFYYRRFSALIGAAGMWNSQFGNDWAVGANISYEPIRDLHLSLSFDRAVRLPTFTDLYYHSATQQADSLTRPEKAMQIELSARYNSLHYYASLSGYYRWGQDVIDWVKNPDPAVTLWRNINNTKVNAAGLEAIVGVQGYEWLRRIELNYSFCDIQADAGGLMSMYALDYLRHKLTLKIEHKIYKGFGASWALSMRSREGQYTSREGTVQNYRPVWLLDGSVYWRNDLLKISVDAKNMADQKYYDFSGVLQPRHWVSATVQFNL